MNKFGEEEIILEIENTPIKCNKKDLILHSDYFKAMFEGNFSERNKTTVKLEGIDVNSINIILLLICHDTYIVENEDILMVLQAACMLQFVKIRDDCITRLTEILSPENCIKIWFVTEMLDLSPLYLKAKNLALMEFQVIKDLDCLLELNLTQLHMYLANINLKTNSEMDVFYVAIKWFYENGENHEDKTGLIFSLFSCIDFNTIPISDLKEIMTYPDICNNKVVIDVLRCLICGKGGIEGNYDEKVKGIVENLLKCKKRMGQDNTDPFFIVKSAYDSSNPRYEVFQDAYKRRRKYIRLEQEERSTGKTAASILLYDKKNNEFQICIDISEDKCNGASGFHIVGYKEQIFLFGGEVAIGTGKWNRNFWVFDTIRERWERKTTMPFGRRHFQSCVCGNYLYIIGGIGSFRIIQDNMFWYNYKDNIWSTQIILPCSSLITKSCNYKNQLFLLSLRSKAAYLYKNDRFIPLKLCDNNNILKDSLHLLQIFSIFSYEDRIYIKGCNLIELSVLEKECEVHVISSRYLKPINYDTMKTILCRDMLYTMYKSSESQMISIEMLSMRTFETSYVLEDMELGSNIKVGECKFIFDDFTRFFLLQHHYKVKENVFINNLSIG